MGVHAQYGRMLEATAPAFRLAETLGAIKGELLFGRLSNEPAEIIVARITAHVEARAEAMEQSL